MRIAERSLETDSGPVNLGGRAFDILAVLTARAGEVVSQRELFEQVWPNTIVEESSLRVHMVGLRKALGDSQANPIYIRTVAGRGYCFVARVQKPFSAELNSLQAGTGADEIIGRSDAMREIADVVLQKRFVTLHGTGGIGKTTVARALSKDFPLRDGRSVVFIDLGSLQRPDLIVGAVAAALNLMVQAGDLMPAILSSLSQRPALIVLDSCEHMIDAVARFAETIFKSTAAVSLLATSREPLRVEGEHVYRLPPLMVPPIQEVWRQDEILSYSAARLFVARARAAGAEIVLDGQTSLVVAEICRKMDGVALALELVAARAPNHSLAEVEMLVASRLRLRWKGRRTAQPRHQTLHDLVQWSYDLLTPAEQQLFRHLSVFPAGFGLDAAIRVAAAGGVEDEADVIELVGQLAAKSLLSVQTEGHRARYRLLDTIRDYAAIKLAESGEAATVARRHALFCLERLTSPGGAGIEDLRAALDWSLSRGNDRDIGVRVVAAATGFLIDRSLIGECRQRTEEAVSVLPDQYWGTSLEMTLQSALGHTLMFSQGNSDSVQSALERGLQLASDLGERQAEFRLLSRLHMYHRRTGEFAKLLPIAQRAQALAVSLSDPAAIASSDVLLGVSYHLSGDQQNARLSLERSRAGSHDGRGLPINHFAFHRNPQIALARAWWLQGYPDRAAEVAADVAEAPASTGDVVTFCIALIWASSVFQWIGRWETVELNAARLMHEATRHSLEPYKAVARGLQADAMIASGKLAEGVLQMREALAQLQSYRYRLYTSALSTTLALTLLGLDECPEALAIIDVAAASALEEGGSIDLPELLRVRGDILTAMGNEDTAQASYRRSVEIAERQTALSWQLRTAMSMVEAGRKRRTGPDTSAEILLARTYSSFREGFATQDLQRALQLIESSRA